MTTSQTSEVMRPHETTSAEALTRATCSPATWICRAASTENWLRDRDRYHTLKGSETRALATVGAFRVVSERDLRDERNEALDVRHLERQGLIERMPLNGQERAVVLTERGRDLLERHRDSRSDHRQTFYKGADKTRERTQDAQIYRAYLKAAGRLQARDAKILDDRKCPAVTHPGAGWEGPLRQSRR